MEQPGFQVHVKISSDPTPILFYDGSCGLCHWCVNLVLKQETAPVIKFATLQGETAARLLGAKATALNTVWFKIGNEYFSKSQAIFALAGFLNFPFSLLSVGKYLPKALSDWLYDIVAKNRHRLGLQPEVCSLPGKDVRARFLP